MRSAEIRFKDLPAGILKEEPDGYSFTYFKEYLTGEDPHPILRYWTSNLKGSEVTVTK